MLKQGFTQGVTGPIVRLGQTGVGAQKRLPRVVWENLELHLEGVTLE